MRHGKSLVLKNVERKVARETVSISNIRRRVLESLRCDNEETLTAARDKYVEDIDIASRLEANENEELKQRHGNIAALLEESALHNNGEMENDGLINEGTCVDFKDDRPEEVERVLVERIVEAVKIGLSKTA